MTRLLTSVRGRKRATDEDGAGSGQVGEAIGSAAFHPQAAAFTSLLHMCAKHKLWQKALEVFEGMKKYHPGVVPNTVHFSSLISACGTAGRWQEAMQVSQASSYLTLPTEDGACHGGNQLCALTQLRSWMACAQ